MTIGDISTGPSQSLDALTLVPLFTPPLCEPMLTFEEAFAAGGLSVQEIGDGRVGTLSVINGLPSAVLALDGDCVCGLRQDRAWACSMIISAHAAIQAPCHCVERGRWSSPSSVRMGEAAHSPSGRFVKMRARSRGLDEQQGVWADIEDRLTACSVASSTSAEADYSVTVAAWAQNLVDGLRLHEGQTGFAVYLRGRLWAVEVFGCPDMLKRQAHRLVRSYAGEARLRGGGMHQMTLDDVLDCLRTDAFEEEPAPGGRGFILRWSGLVEAALLGDTDENPLVHLVAYPS